MEQYGIKETKEAVLGFVVLGKFVAERMKDGAGLDDAMALAQKVFSDEEFKGLLLNAIQGMDKIPAEIKDISFAEALEFAQVIPEIFAKLKAA